ncbi:MAG TPA: outer membrane protein transport protein [Pseudolabrys sp.]|nr:outer membrane protein transport protein [Pseudolabrys sp.]
MRAAVRAAKITTCVIAVWLAGSAAQATEGYFQYGYGARQSGLGGAGVADSRDAMALSLNPAGLVDVDRQLQAGMSFFLPYRSYSASGTAFVAPGSYDSGDNFFPVPNLAYSNPIDGNSAWGIAVFGNGGMNTNWPNMTNTSPGCGGGVGVFCDGSKLHVDLMQAFVSVAYARRFGDISVGIAPVGAIQRIRVQGLGAFAGVSSDPANLSSGDYDYSYGGGARLGVEWKVMPNVRLGVSGQTPIWMTKFHKYAGLFADAGNFDIPANITAGVAWDIDPAVTVMFDYKHIFYGSVASIANPMSSPGLLGQANGPGFGWSDIDIFKIGAEWRATPQWTLRIGYAHNTNPISPADVTFNILAPGVVTDHFTGGFAYKATSNSELEFAAAYAPSNHVSGLEKTGAPPFTTTPVSDIDISMHQFQFTLGYTYHFAPPAPVSPLIHK